MIFNFQFSTFNYFVFLHPKGDTEMLTGIIIPAVIVYLIIKLTDNGSSWGGSSLTNR